MSLSTWFLCVAAVFVLTVTPGPALRMCGSTSVIPGPRKAPIGSLGSTSALVGLMGLSALGLGALLATSEWLSGALKWAGAAYLACLGVRALLAPASDLRVAGGAAAANRQRLLAQGFLVGLSNPKALLFFGALFPRFLDPAAPQGRQFLVLGATFVFFELGWLTVYALTASRAQRWLQRPERVRPFNRHTGAVFLLAAGLPATSRRQVA